MFITRQSTYYSLMHSLADCDGIASLEVGCLYTRLSIQYVILFYLVHMGVCL